MIDPLRESCLIESILKECDRAWRHLSKQDFNVLQILDEVANLVLLAEH